MRRWRDGAGTVRGVPVLGVQRCSHVDGAVVSYRVSVCLLGSDRYAAHTTHPTYDAAVAYARSQVRECALDGWVAVESADAPSIQLLRLCGDGRAFELSDEGQLVAVLS